MIMKEIVMHNTIDYKLIKIRKNTPVLQYLKGISNSFCLRQVTPEMLDKLKKSSHLIDMEHSYPIAGYAPLKGDHFRTSGGLKMSDAQGSIPGSFIIESKRLIYDASVPFYKERDSYVYLYGTKFYTDMGMMDLLKEELNRKRQYLIYMGQRLNGHRFEDQFDVVSKEELLEYAQNCEKGEYILKKRSCY